MQIFFFVYTILAGIMSALQSGSNNSFQKGLNTPWWTIVIVSAITLVCSLVPAVVSGERMPTTSAMGSLPWYAWFGGVFGLGFVIATVFASPKLGAGMFVGLVVTTSTITSLVLDNYGLMQFDVHQAGWGRIIGAVLMIAGVTLISIF